MHLIDCRHERDVLEALASAAWPGGATRELGDHVARCAICTDVVFVAEAMRQASADELRNARVPPAGLVWWRAQIRARQDAARAVARPLTFVHGVAAATIAGLIVGLFDVVSPMLRFWIARLGGLAEAAAPVLEAASPPPVLEWGLPLVLAVAAWLVLAPVAVYFLLWDE